VRQVIVAEAGIQSGEVVRHAAIIAARMGRLKPSLAGDPVALTRYTACFPLLRTWQDLPQRMATTA
jgi:hypothetical protein